MIPIWSPEAINDLAALRIYIEQDDPIAAQRVALHIIHRDTTSEQPRIGTTRPSSGHTRTCDPEDAIHCAASPGWQHDPNSPHLPRRPSMARCILTPEVWRVSCATNGIGFDFKQLRRRTALRDLAAHPREFLAGKSPPLNSRGRRESRVPNAPAASRAKIKSTRA
jgi:hypothetical protein